MHILSPSTRMKFFLFVCLNVSPPLCLPPCTTLNFFDISIKHFKLSRHEVNMEMKKTLPLQF